MDNLISSRSLMNLLLLQENNNDLQRRGVNSSAVKQKILRWSSPRRVEKNHYHFRCETVTIS